MQKDNREDILSEINYTSISLISSKISVGIVGGGKAGFIKAKSFCEKGCSVTVISEAFIQEFNDIRQKLVLIEAKYQEEFLKDKHLIVIAAQDEAVKSSIKSYCDSNCRLYLDATNFKEGMFVMPVQRETDSAIISVNTKGGSPTAAVFMAKILTDKLREYDSYISYVCELRKSLKGYKEKDSIMNFASCEDFKYFYDKHKQELVLKLFYN